MMHRGFALSTTTMYDGPKGQVFSFSARVEFLAPSA